jgi:hypothetical protein
VLIDNEDYAVPWLRKKVAGLSQRTPFFDPMSVLGLVVGKVTLGHVSLRVLWFYPVRIITPMLHNHLHLHVVLNQKDQRPKTRNLPKRNSLWEILKHWIEKDFRLVFTGSDMAQVICRPATAVDRVLSLASPCGICGGQIGTGTSFSPSNSVFPCQYHYTYAPY